MREIWVVEYRRPGDETWIVYKMLYGGNADKEAKKVVAEHATDEYEWRVRRFVEAG